MKVKKLLTLLTFLGSLFYISNGLAYYYTVLNTTDGTFTVTIKRLTASLLRFDLKPGEQKNVGDRDISCFSIVVISAVGGSVDGIRQVWSTKYGTRWFQMIGGVTGGLPCGNVNFQIKSEVERGQPTKVWIDPL